MADSRIIHNLPIRGATTTSGTQYSGYLPVLNADGQIALTFIPATLTGHVSDTSLHLTSSQNTLLDSLTATATELNRVSGVTSNIQTQLDSKAASATTLAGYGIADAQPLDADLTSLAGASSTNTIYYRASAGTWAPVTVGTGLTFASGTLASSVSAAWGAITGTLSSQSDLSSALALKAPLASPTFTGTVTLPSTTSIGTVSSTELGYLDGVTSAIQTQLDAKAAHTNGTLTNANLAGTPIATGPSPTDDSTRVATTAWTRDRIEDVQIKLATAYLNPLSEGTPEYASLAIDFNPWVSAGGQTDGDTITVSTESGALVTFTLRDSPSSSTDIYTYENAENISYTVNGYLQTYHSGSLNSTQSTGTLYLSSIGTGASKRVLVEATRGYMPESLGEDYGSEGTPTGDTSVEVVPAPAGGFKNHILSVSIAGGSGWTGNVTLAQSSYTVCELLPMGLPVWCRSPDLPTLLAVLMAWPVPQPH